MSAYHLLAPKYIIQIWSQYNNSWLAWGSFNKLEEALEDQQYLEYERGNIARMVFMIPRDGSW